MRLYPKYQSLEKIMNWIAIRGFLIGLSILLFACQKPENTEEIAVELPKQITPDSTEIAATVAFYYLENLYDIYNNPSTDDDDFTPNGNKKWNEKRYGEKLDHLAEVLDSIGDRDGAELIGLVEVENAKILQELVKHPLLADQAYQIIHNDMPDPSGLDLALLYKPLFFSPVLIKNFEVQIPDSATLKLRPLVLITGKLYEEEMSILLLQVPFFSKNTQLTTNCTQTYAKQIKVIHRELLRQNPKAKMLIMGSFPPVFQDSLLAETVGITPRINFSEKKIYNPFISLAEIGKGTFSYKNTWYMTEQMWFSESLVTDTVGLVWKPESAGVYAPKWLQRQKPPKEKGKAWASFTEGRFTGGYSSHFPVFMHLERKLQKSTQSIK